MPEKRILRAKKKAKRTADPAGADANAQPTEDGEAPPVMEIPVAAVPPQLLQALLGGGGGPGVDPRELIMSIIGKQIHAAMPAHMHGPGCKHHKDPQVEKRESDEHYGITLPAGMSFRDAAAYCTTKADEQEEKGTFSSTFKCLPWAGAYALQQVLARRYSATKTSGGDVMDVEAVGGIKQVRWGSWNVAGLGKVTQDWSRGSLESGMVINYKLMVHCRNELEPRAQALIEEVREEIEKRELWEGAAVTLDADSEGDLVITQPPRIIELPDITPEDVVLNSEIKAAVEAELFLPIAQPELVQQHGCSPRRGVLLAGRPGTGKTLSARIASKIAVDNGMAVFYLPDSRAIEPALRIAESHAPAVLVCEDIDRQLVNDDDDDNRISRIQNALDGLDRSKHVVVIATTNNPDELPAPILRPGRFDSFIVFDPPNAETAPKLLQMYLNERAPEDVAEAGEALDQLLPASIEEVASRATLHALLNRQEPNPTVEEVRTAASTVRKQQEALEAAEAEANRPERNELAVFHHDGVEGNGQAAAPGNRIGSTGSLAHSRA